MKATPKWASEDRRRSILDEAALIFAREGYRGATTERIAQAAGISQPYVVRMFGSKEALFLEVFRGCVDALLAVFRAAIIADEPADIAVRLRDAYRSLVRQDGIHLLLTQAFVLGADPVVGPAARKGFREIVALLRDEAHLTDDELTAFLARGMLVNVLLGLRMPGTDVAGADVVAVALASDSEPSVD